MELVAKSHGVHMDKHLIYFVDKAGDISSVPRGKGKQPHHKVFRLGIRKAKGYLYFVKNGDVYRTQIKKRG